MNKTYYKKENGAMPWLVSDDGGRTGLMCQTKAEAQIKLEKLNKEEKMLVLTRKQGQSVVVSIGGKQCKIYMTQLKGNVARVGFDAPKDFKITRSELLLNKEAQGVKD